MTDRYGCAMGARMGRSLRQNDAMRLLFAGLMALALFVRIAVPAGFMPGSTAHGITVELCSGVAGQKILIDLDAPAKRDAGNMADGACLFASGIAPHLLAPAVLGVVFALLPVLAAPLGTAIADLTPHRLAAPPPPSQGPPSSR